MAGDDTGPDLRLIACLAAALLGLLCSTAWVLSVPPSFSPAGLLFLFAGLGVCYLGLDRDRSLDVTLSR